MDKVKKLVRYISKYGKCTNKFAASFLLTIFDKNKVFDLSNEKQEIIILNLLSYFDMIVISFDKYGQLNNKKNNNISEKEIFKHIEKKTFDLIEMKHKLKKY